MNTLDILILIPLIWGLYKGFSKGLIIELASIVALILGIWGATTFSDKTANYLKGTFDMQPAHLSLLAFTLTFIIIIILIMLFAKILTGLVDIVALGIVNKILGALFGAFRYALLISILLFILAAADKHASVISLKAKQNSVLYTPVSAIATKLIPAIKTSKAAELLNY